MTPQATSVLVVDDEASFIEALTVGLRREGFEVYTAADGRAALAAVRQQKFDLVLLDVMLPGMSGLDVCREIRKTDQVPLIMVSARAEEIDAVVGLEVGADDYVTKPYRLRELIARMRAVLRRADQQSGQSRQAGQAGQPGEAGRPGRAGSAQQLEQAGSSRLVDGNLELDLDRHEVRVGGELVALALKEFELLACLLQNAGRVVTRDTLMADVWRYGHIGDTKTIDVHIKRLRDKIEQEASNPQRIITIRGLGYRYERVPTLPAAG